MGWIELSRVECERKRGKSMGGRGDIKVRFIGSIYSSFFIFMLEMNITLAPDRTWRVWGVWGLDLMSIKRARVRSIVFANFTMLPSLILLRTANCCQSL